MPKIIDKLINSNDSWSRLKVTHKKVIIVGYNDREEANFDDSTIEISSFYATEGENPDYNSDQKIKEWGDFNQELKVLHPPSDIIFNQFVNEGVRDRVLIEGYGSIEFIIWSVDSDSFWRQKSTTIYLRPLAPL